MSPISPKRIHTSRLLSLRQAFVFTNTYAPLQPEVLVARAHEKFDADGRGSSMRCQPWPQMPVGWHAGVARTRLIDGRAQYGSCSNAAHDDALRYA